jgi:hypothetical protein
MGIPGDRFSILQALLHGGAAQSVSGGPPMFQPTAAQAPAASRDQIMADLFNRISAPEPVAQAPVPEAPNMIQKLLAVLADTGGAYAAGLSGNNALNPRAMEQLRQRREQRDAAIAQNTASGQRAKSESERQKAMLEYQRLLREDERTARATEREGDLKTRAAERAEDRTSREQEMARRQAFEAEQAQKDRDLRVTLENNSNVLRRELAAMEMRRQSDVDKVEKRQIAKEERDQVKQAKAYVVGLSGQLPELLKTKDAEGIRKQALRAFDVLGLTGDARDEALTYYIQEIEPEIATLTAPTEPERLDPFNAAYQQARGPILPDMTGPYTQKAVGTARRNRNVGSR